jgi:hypothetical protein
VVMLTKRLGGAEKHILAACFWPQKTRKFEGPLMLNQRRISHDFQKKQGCLHLSNLYKVTGR